MEPSVLNILKSDSLIKYSSITFNNEITQAGIVASATDINIRVGKEWKDYLTSKTKCFGALVAKWYIWDRLNYIFTLVRNYKDALKDLNLRLKNVTVAVVSSSQLIQHLIQVVLKHMYALFGTC